MPLWRKIKKIWKYLGAGLITGAADDDPAGIITYAIAGAKLGFASLWTAVFTFPLMAAAQEMCARIGMVTQKGLAGVLRKHYPFGILIVMAILMFSANTFNIGADIAGMSAATNLLFPQLPTKAFALIYSALILCLMILLDFKTLVKYLKWLTLSLFFYIVSALFISHNWLDIFKNMLLPDLKFSKETIIVLIAVFGTTISPYLFFWQATEEAFEEKGHHHKIIVTKNELKHMEKDVTLGMLFSNVIMFFVMVLTGTLFFNQGITDIGTVDELSQILGPLLGKFAHFIFTLGIVGTGLLVIPILAGGAAYILSELFGWQRGFDKKFNQAKEFYVVIIVSTAIGLILNYFDFNPIDLLFYTAVFYGIISPPLLLIILSIANNKKIMGEHINDGLSNILGFTAFFVMAMAGLMLFFV